MRNHSRFMFNNNTINFITTRKYLGMILDSKLSFDEHLKSVVLNKRYFLQKVLSRVRLRVTNIQKMAEENLLIV